MAKKVTKKKKSKPKVKLFYQNADKYRRAEASVAEKAKNRGKLVREAYEALGGLLAEGNGYKEV